MCVCRKRERENKRERDRASYIDFYIDRHISKQSQPLQATAAARAPRRTPSRARWSTSEPRGATTGSRSWPQSPNGAQSSTQGSHSRRCLLDSIYIYISFLQNSELTQQPGVLRRCHRRMARRAQREKATLTGACSMLRRYKSFR